MKNSWIRSFFKGVCFTSAIFVFQACYGSPQDFGQDFYIHGRVKSKNTGEPIKGIKVSVDSQGQYVYTDELGFFEFYVHKTDEMLISFDDIDSVDNQEYIRRDTLLSSIKDDKVRLNIELNEK